MRNVVEAERGRVDDSLFLPDDFEFADKKHKNKGLLREPARKRETLRVFMKNKGAVLGLFAIVLVILLAAVGPMVSGYTYDAQTIADQTLPPCGRYWFGTDILGRDIFTRTWIGTRISLYIALVAVAADLCVGMAYGLVSGYFGGKTDSVMQRITEVFSGIPTLVIVTLLLLVLKPGLFTITLALSFTGWIGMSRIARAQVLKLKEQDFVLAARTLGAGDCYIIFREILPNIAAQLLVMSMFSIPNAIFTEAFLAFMGLGVPAPLASLGSLISEAFKSLTTHPYMIAPPVLVLAALMMSFNLLADGLRDALDPKMKLR